MQSLHEREIIVINQW